MTVKAQSAYEGLDPPPLERRLCFSTLVCPDWSLEQIIRGATDSGLNGVDFRGIGAELDITRLPEFSEELVDATTARLRDAGLAVPCLNTSVKLVEPDPAAWARSIDEYARYAELAGRTGTRFVRVFGGAVPESLSREAALGLARDHLAQLADLSATRGGNMPLVESHDAWRTSETLLALLKDLLPSGRAGVLWDIEHPFRAGEKPADTVRHLGSAIRHVHVKDSIRRGDGNDPTLLGEGELPVSECIRLLSHAGYPGWLCLETERRWRASAPPPERSVPQFAAFVRQALLSVNPASQRSRERLP